MKSKNTNYTKKDLFLVCSIITLEENLKIMTDLKKVSQYRSKYSFSYLDAILIFYYFYFGLQCENAINYIEYYIKYELNPHAF